MIVSTATTAQIRERIRMLDKLPVRQRGLAPANIEFYGELVNELKRRGETLAPITERMQQQAMDAMYGSYIHTFATDDLVDVAQQSVKFDMHAFVADAINDAFIVLATMICIGIMGLCLMLL